MERLLLPLTSIQEPSDVTIVQWHVEEGTPLREHLPLVTIQMGTQTQQCFFRRKADGFVLKQRMACAGEPLDWHETLALVGRPEDSLPDGIDIETIPLFGTSVFIQHGQIYLRMLRITMLCAGLLIVLRVGVDVGVGCACLLPPEMLRVLGEVLDAVGSIAFGCLLIPFFIIVALLVLFLREPVPKHAIRLQPLPALPKQERETEGARWLKSE